MSKKPREWWVNNYTPIHEAEIIGGLTCWHATENEAAQKVGTELTERLHVREVLPGEDELLTELGEACKAVNCLLERAPEAVKESAEQKKLITELVAACKESLTVAEECYLATGHIRVAKTSEQRLRIESALEKAKELGYE